MCDADEIVGGAEVEHHAGVVVELEEGGGHGVGDRSLDGVAHHPRAGLAPCHGHHFGRAQDVAQTEGDACGGTFVALVAILDELPHGAAEKHQAADARGARAGLVEAERASGAYLAEGEIDAAAVVDLTLILLTEVEHALHGHSGADGVHIFVGDVDMVEKHLAHTPHGGGAAGEQREKLAEVEDDYIFEAHLAAAVHGDEMVVDAESAHAGAESQHAAPLLGHTAADHFGHMAGGIEAAAVYALEDAGVDLFVAGEGSDLYVALGVVVAPRDAVELYLSAKVGFHLKKQ